MKEYGELCIPNGNFDAIIFDLDGTLVDSMPAHFVAWCDALSQFNVPKDVFPEDVFYSMGGRPTTDIVAELNGEFGLQALEPGWITSRQIEAIRRVVVRHNKRRGKYWIRIFPDKPVTAKPAETRMGKGKGSVDHYVAVVKPGRILFEIAGVPEESAREALRFNRQLIAG